MNQSVNIFVVGMELSREAFRAMIYYDFCVGLNEKDCHQRLRSAFGDTAPSYTTVFRWYKDFQRSRMSLQDEGCAGRPPCATTPDLVTTVQDMVSKDPSCIPMDISFDACL